MRKRFFAICLVSIVLIAVVVPSCAAPPEGEMGMDDAIDVVVDDILPTIPEILQGIPYLCLRLPSPLIAGTVIEEDSGSTLRLTLGEEMFFFYLDLAPGHYYEHDVEYILVDKNGNHEEYDAKWWPRIDGAIPEGLVKFPPDEDDVIAGNIELEVPTGVAMSFDFYLPKLQWCEGFIVVQGLMTDEGLYSDALLTYRNGIEFFNEYKNECSRVEGLVQSQAADVLDIIDDMVEEGRNPITIYIIAHGGIDRVRLGGQWFTANQFRNKMAAHPDTIFNFILGSCHSGSFIDDLNTLDNICAVETACSADEGATPDWDSVGSLHDYNYADSGSEWTSSLLEAMSTIVEDEGKFAVISKTASQYNVPETCVLICHGGWAALGADPGFGLTQDLDLSHLCGETTPRHYCCWETIS